MKEKDFLGHFKKLVIGCSSFLGCTGPLTVIEMIQISGKRAIPSLHSPSPSYHYVPPSFSSSHTIFSIQSVQMAQSSCRVSLLIGCRIAAFPLLSLLMHQPVVFVLQSKRVTPPPTLEQKELRRGGTSRTKTKLGSDQQQRQSPPITQQAPLGRKDAMGQ